MVSSTNETGGPVSHLSCSTTDTECIQELPFQETFPSSSAVTQMIFVNLLCILGLIGSVCTTVFLVNTARKDVLSRYVVSRAVAGILISLTGPFDAATNLYRSWFFGDVLCKFRNCLVFLAYGMNAAIMVGMCVNTYIEECVSTPSLKLQSAVFKVISILAWSLSLMMGLSIFVRSETLKEVLGESVHCVSGFFMENTTASQALRIMTVIFCCIIPVIVSWIILTLTILNKKRQLLLTSQELASGSLTLLRRAKQLTFSITVTFTVFQAIYFLPYLILELVDSADTISSIMKMLPVTGTLPAINVVIDAVLYAFFMQDAYKYVKKMSSSTDDNRMIPLIPLD
ncbi:kappa-type opioid receptor-like [Macrobrachium nipponense]|uniref:kappa-type opioid receptor-like n=1 Tax=Macrobrachium nipponense TaxID=159736 RepID=UPI0030C828D7